MHKGKYHCVYGPVASWRLGRSLGIDLIASDKTCSFDCVYCQLGKTKKHTAERKVFVPTEELLAAVSKLPPVKFDYITFSGMGEPTLAKNLGEAINALRKKIKKPIAVLTNSSLMSDAGVRKELALADMVVAKLDAPSEECLYMVDKPVKGISLKDIVNGLKEFSQKHRSQLALQIMFVPQNKVLANEMSALAKEINPGEIQINTPLRPSGASPITKNELNWIKNVFIREFGRSKVKIFCVYDVKRPNVKPLDLIETAKRRPELRKK